MMERPVCRIPVRPSTPLYDVLVDSDLDIRGRTPLWLLAFVAWVVDRFTDRGPS